jgi:hypothetical protein
LQVAGPCGHGHAWTMTMQRERGRRREGRAYLAGSSGTGVRLILLLSRLTRVLAELVCNKAQRSRPTHIATWTTWTTWCAWCALSALGRISSCSLGCCHLGCELQLRSAPRCPAPASWLGSQAGRRTYTHLELCCRVSRWSYWSCGEIQRESKCVERGVGQREQAGR